MISEEVPLFRERWQKQPEVFFKTFYVNMVRAGEESGKLTDTFTFLADYLERNYALTSKTKNALVYLPLFVFTFITVMVLMLVKVIPQMAGIIEQSGQQIPVYTRITLSISVFLLTMELFLDIDCGCWILY